METWGVWEDTKHGLICFGQTFSVSCDAIPWFGHYVRVASKPGALTEDWSEQGSTHYKEDREHRGAEIKKSPLIRRK